MTTFTQLNARLKNFLRGWLFVLGQKEGLLEFATVCIKSEVILKSSWYQACNPKTVKTVAYFTYNLHPSVPWNYLTRKICFISLMMTNRSFFLARLINVITTTCTALCLAYTTGPISLWQKTIKLILNMCKTHMF